MLGAVGGGRHSASTTFVAMGQPVAVVEKQSAIPGIVRFVANRSLTGMGHERFTEADQAVGPRPAACSTPARSSSCTCTATS